MSAKKEMEPAWKRKAPGLERAKVVMEPHAAPRDLVYVVLQKPRAGQRPRDLLEAMKCVLGKRVYYDNGRAYELVMPPTAHTRMISALRTGRAVEIDDFLAVCADEELEVVFADGWWRVYSGSSGAEYAGQQPTDAICMGRAHSLRGAYRSYHVDRAKREKAAAAAVVETPAPTEKPKRARKAAAVPQRKTKPRCRAKGCRRTATDGDLCAKCAAEVIAGATVELTPKARKLSDEARAAVVAAKGKRTARELAEEHGVGISCVTNIWRAAKKSGAVG